MVSGTIGCAAPNRHRQINGFTIQLPVHVERCWTMLMLATVKWSVSQPGGVDSDATTLIISVVPSITFVNDGHHVSRWLEHRWGWPWALFPTGGPTHPLSPHAKSVPICRCERLWSSPCRRIRHHACIIPIHTGWLLRWCPPPLRRRRRPAASLRRGHLPSEPSATWCDNEPIFGVLCGGSSTHVVDKYVQCVVYCMIHNTVVNQAYR